MSQLGHFVLGAGQPLITFGRMLVIVFFGLITVYLDGRWMNHRGLYREEFWAKIIGWSLVVIGIGSWLAFKILGDY
ncbi:MAG: hypothetical protein GX318_08255 [Clostridia bacterium]|nr:hypothetical protein [Clostridia bacterium]